MIDRGRLLALSQLKLAEIMESMDDNQFLEYNRLLVAFTDAVPAQEESLKAAMEARDYVSYMQRLADIWDMLVKIHAYDMARFCLEQIDELKKLTHEKAVDHEKVTAETTRFITAWSTLSIDIQMAMYRKTDPAQIERKEKHILAVDDAPFFLTTLKNCMKNTPYKLTCVTSGAAALRFLENQEPDLFILDIEMPEMNGYELAEMIKQGGMKAPVIFLAGNATKQNVLKAIEVGGTDFIVKPLDRGILLNTLEKYLR